MQQHFESTSAFGASASLKIGGNPSAPSHIPYRDSKLTRLLQHSLSGNAKTVIFLTISNATAHAAETISTLKFGERARLVVTKPRINVGDSLTMEAPMFFKAKMAGYENEISEYQRIIEQLQSQVVSMQSVIEDLQSENATLRQSSSAYPSHLDSTVVCCRCNGSSISAISAEKKSRPLDPMSPTVTPKRLQNNVELSDKENRNVKLEDQPEASAEKTSDLMPRGEEKSKTNEEDDEDEDEDEYNDRCGICGMNQDESDRLQDTTGENLGFFFHCDGNCGSMFHIRCVGLIGEAGQYILPEGEWFCLSCQHDLELNNRREGENPPEEIAMETPVDASSINQQQPMPEGTPHTATVSSSLKSDMNSSRESPLKAALSTTQHELHMARLWQQQYDVIRKDRNRILLQWQQDQESFRVYQQQRLQLQEERENCILQLEEKQLELTASLNRQQEENLTLKSCLKDLQDRYTMMQQRSSVSPFYSSMALSSSIDEETEVSNVTHQDNGKRFNCYDAAYAFDDTEMDSIDQEGHTDNMENTVIANEMADLPAAAETVSAKVKNPANSPSKRQGKTPSSLPPAHGAGKNAQRKGSTDKGSGQKSALSLSSTLPASTRVAENNSKGPKRSLPDISVTSQNSGGSTTLIRSASDRVPSEDSENSSTLPSPGVPVSSATAAGSRFVNPLRNRLSELIAQADEEKESFVDLRMKLQSRAEGRGSREGLR